MFSPASNRAVETRPGQFPAFDVANLDYRGFRYRPEMSRHGTASYFHHWVYHPDGYCEAIAFQGAHHLTPSQFRLLVDLDMPEPSDFYGHNKVTGRPIFTSPILFRISRYREENGVYDIDVMRVMMALAEYSVWDAV